MHIVYLFEFSTEATRRKYIGSKSNASIIDGKIFSDGNEYLTSSRSTEFRDMLNSGVEYTVSSLGEFKNYKEALEFEYKCHKEEDVCANIEYFNLAMAAVNNFSDPNYGTFKHSVDGKAVRLPRDHPLAISKVYVGVTKDRKLSQEHKDSIVRSGPGNSFFGRKHTKETKAIIGEMNKKSMLEYWESMDIQQYEVRREKFREMGSMPKSKEYKAKLAGSTNLRCPLTGTVKRFYRDEIEKMKLAGWIHAKTGIPEKRIKCEHCGVESNGGNYKRWHGSNCKNFMKD